MNVLLIEDDDDLREVFSACLESKDVNIINVKYGEEAIGLIEKNQPPLDLVITDNRLLGINGVELVLYLRDAKISYPPFLFVAGSRHDIPRDFLDMGVIAILDKESALSKVEEIILSFKD